MQLPLFAERVSDLALELTDLRLDEQRRLRAGDALIQEIQSGHGTFEDLADLSNTLALGMKLFKNEKRYPARPGDFIFTDQPLVRLATVFTMLGERLDRAADHSRNRQEQDDVRAFRQRHGIDDFRTNLFEDIKDHDLKAMAAYVEKVAENSANLHEADDDLITGQSTLLDIPLAILAQFYLAAGQRLSELTTYSPPPLN